jgi:hypothetical protein
MRQRAGVIGERFNIEKYGVGNMARAIFGVQIAIFLPRRRHSRIDNLNFRVINMFRQPVGGDKNEVDMVSPCHQQ